MNCRIDLPYSLFVKFEWKWTIRKRILRDVVELNVHLNLIQDESKLWIWKVNVTGQDVLLGFHLILDWRAARGRVTGDWGWLRAGFIGRRCRISVQGCLIMGGTVVNQSFIMTMALLSKGENNNFIVWNASYFLIMVFTSIHLKPRRQWWGLSRWCSNGFSVVE